LEELDPSCKRPDNNVSKQTLEKETNDLYDFLEQQNEDEKIVTDQKGRENKIFDSDKLVKDLGLSKPEQRMAGEMEKNKGNEAFRSKDFQEAKEYYTKSLVYFKDAKVYSNRAAV